MEKRYTDQIIYPEVSYISLQKYKAEAYIILYETIVRDSN